MAKPPLGEFELISRLAGLLPGVSGAGVVGIGDDAAAIPHGGGVLLLTCDVVVEGRHFVRGRNPMADLGWKLATSCVSDVVACGGRPRHALVSLGVPSGMAQGELDALYEGLAEAARHYDFQVLGGNVSGAEGLFADCFMVGEAPRFVARSGARPGDRLAVSGTLGDSDAGLALLTEDQPAVAKPDEAEAALVRRHLRPTARLDVVEWVREAATAAIDISDSLASELHHLAQASGTRLEAERAALPLSPELKHFCEGRGEDPYDRALHGGEDYQLLVTVPPDRAGEAEARGFTLIGEVRAGSGVWLSGQPLIARGWDHLRVSR